MPYKFKGKKDCKQSSGESGKFLTVKKNGSKRCYKSEKQYKAAQAWAHESEELEDEPVITEEKIRQMIRNQLVKSWKSVKKKQRLQEKKEDIDLDLAELDLPAIPPVLKKLLDPNITPAKYADIDQIVDQSGNKDHQAFAIAAFILSYADMDEGVADAIITKTRGLIPKILKARQSAAEKPKEDQATDQQEVE